MGLSMLEARFAETLRREQQYSDLETEPLLALPTDQASDNGDDGSAAGADSTAHSRATYGSVGADHEEGVVYSSEGPRVTRLGEGYDAGGVEAPDMGNAQEPRRHGEAGGTAPDGHGR